MNENDYTQRWWYESHKFVADWLKDLILKVHKTAKPSFENRSWEKPWADKNDKEGQKADDVFLGTLLWGALQGEMRKKVVSLPDDMEFNNLFKEINQYDEAFKVYAFFRYDGIIDDNGIVKGRRNNYGAIIEHLWDKHFEYRDYKPCSYPEFYKMAQIQHGTGKIGRGHFKADKDKDNKKYPGNEKFRNEAVRRYGVFKQIS